MFIIKRTLLSTILAHLVQINTGTLHKHPSNITAQLIISHNL